MNFLAHLVLAPQTPEGLIGSIAPDMIRGPLPADLHEAVMAAAKEHQRVDRFTDAHRAFRQTRVRLRTLVDSRLTGVLADVLYDHVLARGWSRWRRDGFEAYVSQAEQGLMDALGLVPDRMQMIVRKMIQERWLASYATPQGIRARLDTMSQRLTRRLDRPMSLAISGQALAEHKAQLTEDFAALWPDLLDHVEHGRTNTQDTLAD